MNNDEFLKHIEETRMCNSDLLDNAINMGIKNALNNRLDTKKIFYISASAVLTFALCYTISFMPLETYLNNHFEKKSELISDTAKDYGLYLSEYIHKNLIDLGDD